MRPHCPLQCNGRWSGLQGRVLSFPQPPILPILERHLSAGEFLVFPVRKLKEVVSTYFEDDGKTELHKQNCNLWSLKVSENQVVVTRTIVAQSEPAGRLFTLKVGTRKFEFNPASLNQGESISFAF